jgi:ubiquinone/menaquinone biosynthesis C-methylase UbiE
MSEFDAHSQDYDRKVNQALAFSGLRVDYFTKVKAAYLLDIIADAFGAARKVDLIDIGCGIGNYHPSLSPRVGRLAGVDVSADCIETARRRNGAVEYATFDGRILPYPDDSFDVAIAICVLHHVPVTDRPGLLNEVRRTLRPNGRLVIFEHNPSNPLTMRVVNNCEFDKNAVLLKRSECERLLNESGFSDVTSKFILTAPSFGRFTRKIDSMFSSLSFGAQYYTIGKS